MIDFIKLRILHSSAYWDFRHRLNRAKYHYDRFRYNTRTQSEGLRFGLSIIGQIFRLSFSGLIVAAFSLLVLQSAEFYYEKYLSGRWIALPELSENSDTFIELISQITATLLGIYFATFGIIISSGYSKLRRDVIDLLLSEKVNNFYTRCLVHVTVFCLGAVWLGHLGHPTGVFVFVVATIGGAVSLLCLFTLGNRLFAFFDTTPLVQQSVVPDIRRAILICSSSTNVSPHIQNHQRQIAQLRLETMNYLVTTSETDNTKATNRRFAIAEQYSKLLTLYGQVKQRIEPQSYWFKRKQVHKDWFTASGTTIDLALNSSRQLEPETIPNLGWFEESVNRGFVSTFSQSLSANDLNEAQRIAFLMFNSAQRLAENLLLEDAINLVLAFETVLDKYIEETTANKVKEDISSQQLALLELYEIISAANQSVAVEFLRNIIIEGNKIKISLQPLFRGNLSKYNPPSFLHNRYQRVRNWVEFEKKIEGRVLTRNEFILQFMSQGVSEHLQKSLELITSRFERTLVERVELLKDRYPMAACQVLFGGLGSINQVLYFSDIASGLAKTLKANEVYTEYTIPQPNFEDFERSLQALRDSLLSNVSQSWAQDYFYKNFMHDENIPDYYGQSYFVLAEECIAALEQNNPQRFDQTFRAFFVMAHNAYSTKFQQENERYSQTYLFALISSAIEDILTLSGFALIYDTLNSGADFKATIYDVWERYADADPNKGAFFEKFVELANLNYSAPTTTHRNIIRINWKMRFEKRMRKEGYEGRLGSHNRKRHPSPIIAAIYPSYSHSAADLFIADYILPKLDNNIELNHRLRGLVRRLKKERENERP